MEQDTKKRAAFIDAYYEQLVTRYWQPLSAFVQRRTGSLQDTEDIVQEAFVHAYYALERYPLERIRTLQARPWLYKITWNVYRNYRSRHQPPQALSLESPEEGLLLDLANEWQEQPEAIVERGERRREMTTLVDTLPEHYREVINLYYFDELSHQEIADLLHQPLGTIKTHVHRGLRLLRKAFQTKEERSMK